MAERGSALQEKNRMSTGQSQKRFRVLETAFLTEDNEDLDSPAELLLPDEHPAQREVIIRKWLNSSTSTITEEDESDERRCVAKDTGVFAKVKVSSSCMCKLFVVLYLLGCLLVSTLYIAIYGPNELYLMPETSHKSLTKVSHERSNLLIIFENAPVWWLCASVKLVGDC